MGCHIRLILVGINSFICITLFESTPSTKALVRSVALMVVFKFPSTYTWYDSGRQPSSDEGAFHPISTLLFNCLSNVSCFGAGTSSEKNMSKCDDVPEKQCPPQNKTLLLYASSTCTSLGYSAAIM